MPNSETEHMIEDKGEYNRVNSARIIESLNKNFSLSSSQNKKLKLHAVVYKTMHFITSIFSKSQYFHQQKDIGEKRNE